MKAYTKYFRQTLAAHYPDDADALLDEVDFVTTNLAGLQLVRTGTIATGAAKCDFRFQKAEPPPAQT